jgi:hypothetical protein
MAQIHSEQIRQDLAEIRKRVEECRRDLGIGNGESSRVRAKRSGGLLRRRLRSAR